jgi:hypothetical protein
MPRDGLQQYAPPPGTQGVANYTIESARYNTFVADITADQNNARPIVSGGTGASTARDALINLSGEMTGQAVDNYDSFPFVSGSFYSVPGAIGAPDNPTGPSARYYTGICYAGAGTITIEATDMNVLAHPKYMRSFNTTWAAWMPLATTVSDMDARFVNLVGDTMTGNLGISTSVGGAYLELDPTAAGQQAAFSLKQSGVLKWQIGKQVDDSFMIYDTTRGDYALTVPSNGTTLSTAKNFQANGSILAGVATANTGAYYFGNNNTKYLTCDGTNYTFAGSSVSVNVIVPNLYSGGAVTAVASVTTGQGGLTGTYYFGNTGTKSLQYNGTQFQLSGGDLLVVTNVWAGVGLSTGTYYFGNTGAKYLQYDGSNFNFVGGQLIVPGLVSRVSSGLMQLTLVDTTTGHNKFIRNNANNLEFVNHANSLIISQMNDAGDWSMRKLTTTTGEIACGYGYVCKAGISGGFGSNYFNLLYASGPTQLWIDATNFGNITVSSDYRIKKDVINLPGMWDTVKALRPIKYTQAQYTPKIEVERRVKEAAEERKQAEAEGREPKPAEPPQPMFAADDIERWGFIAHELQDALTPSAATGYKDAPDHVQSPNPFTIIAALTKALQEAMARIEALEAR